MKNGYVWEIRTRILFYIALCIALVFMMQHSVTWKLPDFIELLLKYIVLLLSLTLIPQHFDLTLFISS